MKQNGDDVTEDEVQATYTVLENLRESLNQSGLQAEAKQVNEAHYLVQQYDEGSNWSDDDSGEEFYIPDSGEEMYDPYGPSWGDETVVVEKVKDNVKAVNDIILVGKKETTVYKQNKQYGCSKDAPVVVAHYKGSTKSYSFPVDRLESLET